MKGLKFLFLILFLLIPFNFVLASGLININTASSEELQTLNGIGPVYAERIIEYRKVNGFFQKTEDIKNVSGIGDATFLKIKDYITIGDVDTPGDSEDEPEDQEEGEEETVIPPTSSGGSSHSSPVSLVTASSPKPKLEVSAGRNRLGVAGAPLVFEAENITEQDLSGRIYYDWTTGDGFAKSGESIEHIYEFPGIYEVVLNSSAGSVNSVSRIRVEIVLPSVVITDFNQAEGFLILENGGNREINLGGWKLSSKQTEYIFPVDTIISADNELKLSLSIFDGRELGDNISLSLPNGKEVVDYLEDKQATAQEETLAQEVIDQNIALQETERNYALLQSRVRELENQLAQATYASQVKEEEKEEPIEIEKEIKEEIKQTSTSSSQSVIKPETALVLKPEDSFWQRVFRRATFWR